jgi:hypothetical protein
LVVGALYRSNKGLTITLFIFGTATVPKAKRVTFSTHRVITVMRVRTIPLLLL